MEKLFTTHDGVDIYKGDYHCFIPNLQYDWNIVEVFDTQRNSPAPMHGGLDFSTMAAAKTYRRDNKPSPKDTFGRPVTTDKYGDEFTFYHGRDITKKDFKKFMHTLTEELCNNHDFVDVCISRGQRFDNTIDKNSISGITFKTGIIG